MEDIFSKQQLPSGSTDIADLLRGNGAHFELEAFGLTSAGRPRSALRPVVMEVRRGIPGPFQLANAPASGCEVPL